MSDEIMEIPVVDESELDSAILLDDTNRCIAMDCIYTDKDNVITLKRKDLPLEYNEFACILHDFKYEGGRFIYLPMQEVLKQESQFNDLVSQNKKIVLLNLDDETAASIPCCYPSWASYIGKSFSEGDRIEYEGKLWKVRQDISAVLENQPPSMATAALYEVINIEHAGTIEDPIPYDMNMEVFKDKYYIENDVKYKCIRDSGQPLYVTCASLVDNYFELA